MAESCSIVGCVNAPLRKGRYVGICTMHRDRIRRTGDAGPAHQVWGRGISPGWVTQNGYREIFRDGRVQKEHRYVMSQRLGRALLPSEDVHHINGDKLDNRAENPELWSSSQPRGQRVEDKLRWCLELLSTYAPHLLAEEARATRES